MAAQRSDSIGADQLPRAAPRRRVRDLDPRAAQVGEGVGRRHVRERIIQYRHLLLWADLAAGLLAVAATGVKPSNSSLMILGLVGAPSVVVAATVTRVHASGDAWLGRSPVEEIPQLFQFAAVFTLLFAVLSTAAFGDGLPVAKLGAMWIAFLAGLLAARGSVRAATRHWAPRKRFLLAGSAEECEQLRRMLARNPKTRVDGVASIPLRPRRTGETAWTPDLLAQTVNDHAIDRVIIGSRCADSDDVFELVRAARSDGLAILVAPRLLELFGSAVEFDELEGMPLVVVRHWELSRSAQVLKRAFDLLGAGAMLLLAGPAILVIAIMIHLDSPGPVFFHQLRIGRFGQRFRICKFRTMVQDAESLKAGLHDRNESEGLFKIRDDPRITRVGRLLRRTKLDELPQLLNVLRGEMSLVGPRPLVIEEDLLVEGQDRERLRLTPGMTGPWQLLGPARVSLAEMVKIDYRYVTGWSLWTDLRILLGTVANVFSRTGI